MTVKHEGGNAGAQSTYLAVNAEAAGDFSRITVKQPILDLRDGKYVQLAY